MDSLSVIDVPSIVAFVILITSLCYLLYSLCAMCRESFSTPVSVESKEYHSVRQVDDENDDGVDEEDSAIEMTYAS